MPDLFNLGYAEVPIKVGRSGYVTKRASIPVLGDDPRHYEPLIALALNPEMVEWLISCLPHTDSFTQTLESIRDEMRDELWKRATA